MVLRTRAPMMASIAGQPPQRSSPSTDAEADPPASGDLSEHLFDAVIVCERASGRIQQWNRAAAELYGWSAREAIGQPAWHLLHTSAPLPRARIGEELDRAGVWQGEL